jgi:hypothetical protein
MWNKVRSGK